MFACMCLRVSEHTIYRPEGNQQMSDQLQASACSYQFPALVWQQPIPFKVKSLWPPD